MKGTLSSVLFLYTSGTRHGHGVVVGTRFQSGTRVLRGSTRYSSMVEGLLFLGYIQEVVTRSGHTTYKLFLIRGGLWRYTFTHTQHTGGRGGFSILSFGVGVIRYLNTITTMRLNSVAGFGRFGAASFVSNFTVQGRTSTRRGTGGHALAFTSCVV